MRGDSQGDIQGDLRRRIGREERNYSKHYDETQREWAAVRSLLQGQGRVSHQPRPSGGNSDINGEGWQTVVKKKRSANPANRFHETKQWSHYSRNDRGNINTTVKRGLLRSETEKAYQRAFNEGRCYRCLSKQHQRANCREPVRCFKCKKIGHKYGSCTLEVPHKKEQAKPTYKAQTKHQSYAQALKSTKELKERPQSPEEKI